MIYSNISKGKLKGYKYKYMTIEEMAKRVSKSSVIYLDTETFAKNFDEETIVDTYLEAYQVRTGKTPTAKTLQSAKKHAEDIRFDMCVDARRSAIRLIQIATDTGDIFVFDSLEGPKTDKDTLLPVFEAIQGKPICGHNLKFDLKVLLTRWPKYVPGSCWCTMIGYKLVRSAEIVGFFHSALVDVVKYHTGIVLEKGHGGDDWSKPITAEQLNYSVLDVAYLEMCMLDQCTKLNGVSIESDDEGYFNGMLFDKVSIIEMRFVEVVAHIELAGMPLNVKGLKERADKFRKELADLKKPFDQMKINTQSPVQLLKFLDSQGVDVISTDKGELTKYVHIPIVKQLMEVKTMQKELQMIDDYCNEIMQSNGRVYANFNQMRATDGRMSSSDFNAQQIPRAIKKIFYAFSKTVSIIRADYPAIEARIMGIVAPDNAIKEIFKNKRDMHTVSASEFLNKREKDVTPFERLKAKAANFGFMFGMGALTFIRYAFTNYGLVVSLEEATSTREKYLKKYSGVKRFHNLNSAKLQDSREITVRTLLGRRMRVDGFTNANNYPVQGSAADMIKLAAVIFFNKMRKMGLGGKIINIVHDELVVESSKTECKKVAKVLAESMNYAADYIIEEFPTEVEIEIS